MKVLLFFIDGFGIGKKNSKFNPLYLDDFKNIRNLFDNHLIETDPILGVEGLPQSATGQTTILTGKNAPEHLGYHLRGLPNDELRKLINDNNIFKDLKKRGFKVTNANAYHNDFLNNMKKNLGSKYGVSVSTEATLSAQLKFRDEKDLSNDKAVYQDITNKIIIDNWNGKVNLISPTNAAKNLSNIVKENDFTFFEYFQTDIVGHKMDINSSLKIFNILDEFIGSLIKNLDFENTLLIITSDHGNIEDLSIKTHTLNKVPTFLIGKNSELYKSEIKSIKDIMPMIIDVLN